MTRGDPGNPVSSRPLVVAIDGPAGAGKSTVSQAVARRLGILYLNTGAMYRAATLAVLDSGIDPDDAAAVASEVCRHDIGFDAEGAVQVDGQVCEAKRLRSPATTAEIWRVADNPTCRAHLVSAQQAIVAGRDAVIEGRDATTVICPTAALKIYLDASPEERARRRVAEWSGTGTAPALDEVASAIRERDHRDSSRAVGALRLADDAVPLLTDGLSPHEVVARILALAVQRRPLLLEARVTDQLIVGRSRQPGYVRVAQGSIMDPPRPWQLGLTNPSPDRTPDGTHDLSRNRGGRQAGVLCQGSAVIVLGGRGDQPDRELMALPMLPQTWYVLEPGAWHAVVQRPGTICAWAESSTIVEDRHELDAFGQQELRSFLDIYLPT